LPRYHKRKVIVNPEKLRFYTIGLLIQISDIGRCHALRPPALFAP
jgi:hypothetical protein